MRGVTSFSTPVDHTKEGCWVCAKLAPPSAKIPSVPLYKFHLERYAPGSYIMEQRGYKQQIGTIGGAMQIWWKSDHSRKQLQ